MKRVLALLMALCLLGSSAMAESLPEPTQTLKLEKNGLQVFQNEIATETGTLVIQMDYPTFTGEDTALTDYLDQTITQLLLKLARTDLTSTASSAYDDGAKDNVRMGFAASMDFAGILSVEASVSNRSADRTVNEMLFFYRMIDLATQQELSIYDLFTEPRDTVDSTLRSAVFSIEQAQGLAIVSDASQVPAPNSYYLSASAFRCLFAAGAVAEKACVVDIPWDQLSLTPSAVMTGSDAAPTADANADAPADTETDPADAAVSDGELTGDALLATLLANDWTVNDDTLRFQADGSIIDPADGDALFTAYELVDGYLFLDDADRPGQGVTVTTDGNNLRLTFDTETSDYTTLDLLPDAAADQTASGDTADTAAPQQAIPTAPSAPVDVTTPTPMPVTGDDATAMDFLTAGLWKPLGTDGDTYYQFTADGKLLTIEVSAYSLSDGSLSSDALAGDVSLGGNTFTLTMEDGTQVAYVLNRTATAVAPEEFVTATPTPTPGPTPTPSPIPTPSPTPSPTPEPTPTLSPYEIAVQTAPSLATLGDATFEKRQTFKVYSSPDTKSYRDSKAQVTTDETVSIFGVTGDWVLVGYSIGNGSRGRIGYIGIDTLNDAANVAQLSFADIEIKLTKKAAATDDPLNGKGTLFSIGKDESVKLLAFLGTDWAYVETQYKGKVCRVFIPRSSLIAE